MAEWISVNDRLPKYGDYVLGIGPKHGYYISEYRGKVGIQLRPWFVAQGRSVKITHWMPLPEPPKEGGCEDGWTDCFYCVEDKDMGATIPWCTSKKTICEPHQCNGCQDFISKAEVHDVASHILEERRADND